MRIAIFGATGAVGTTLLSHLLKGTDLVAGDELILVGRGTQESLSKLLAMRADLLDAFEAGIVEISVCESMCMLEPVDIFIMAAGATLNKEIKERRLLAEKNLPLFHEVARSLDSRCNEAFVLIITNPVELAVEVFCRYVDQRRVLGMGAQQDSNRFARAIATQLDLPRAAIRASVLGEHGEGMVPLWSSAYVVDGEPSASDLLESLRVRHVSDDAATLLPKIRSELWRFIERGQAQEAYEFLRTISPALKIAVEPDVTVRVLRSTPNSTANATLDCIAAIRHSDERKIHGQVLLSGEFYGLRGVMGAPIVLRRSEWRIGSYLPLTIQEVERLRQVNRDVNDKYRELIRSRSD
jgi:malate dehydrogenase